MEWLVYLAGVGLVLIILGIINIITYNNKKKKYVRTIGYIARYETSPYISCSRYAYGGIYEAKNKVAIINFRVGTRTYWIRSNKLSIDQAVPGTPREVYYNPDDPNEAILGNDCPGIMNVIVGTILLCISLYFILSIIYMI